MSVGQQLGIVVFVTADQVTTGFRIQQGVRTRATVASEKPNRRGSHCGDKKKKTKGLWPDLIHKLGYRYREGGERFKDLAETGTAIQ